MSSSCIHCQSPFFPMLSLHKLNQQPNTAQLLWLTRNQPNRHLYNQNSSVKTKAIPIANSLLLGVTKKPDITVFLWTSALLLFMFWISNFVVPEMVLKDLQSDQTSEDQKPDVDNNLIDFDNRSITSEGSKRSRRKKNAASRVPSDDNTIRK